MNNKAWARRSVRAAVMAAGIVLFAGTAAQAADVVSYNNTFGGNGTQVLMPVQAPVDVCGDEISFMGVADAACVDGGADADMSDDGIADMYSHDNTGLLNGTQVQTPVQVPVNVCGVAAAVGAVSKAACAGGGSASLGTDGQKSPTMDTGFNSGVLNGTQVMAPIQVPVNLCGLGVSAFGKATGACAGAASAKMPDGASSIYSSDNWGVGNGTQVVLPIQVPVNFCGNAISAFGDAAATCDGPGRYGPLKGEPSEDEAPAPEDGLVPDLGRAANLPAVKPVTNLPLLGNLTGPTAKTSDGSAPTGAKTAADAAASHDHSPVGVSTSDNVGLIGGWQLVIPIQLPVNAAGNSIAGAGVSDAYTADGTAAAAQLALIAPPPRSRCS